MTAIANPPVLEALWLDPADGLVARIERARARIGAHATQTVVLLPYAQLVPLAQAMWTRALRSGFAPRFETSQHWARSLAAQPSSPQSIQFDAARDGATARALLEQAGLQSHAGALAARLVDAAYEVAPVVAAIPPHERAAWAEQARAAVRFGWPGDALAFEAAICRIALEWALASDHGCDPLWHAIEQQPHAIGALIVLEGLNPDPLAHALKACLGARAESIDVTQLVQQRASRGGARVHAALDAEDEAERAAACVMRHLNADRAPVALAATDRVLARRVQALLVGRGVPIRDETGWALSTTRAAAHAMAALSAAAWNAPCDVVLDWLKNAPAFVPAVVRRLEQALRRAGIAQWQSWWSLCDALHEERRIDSAVFALATRAERLRAELRESRPFAQWLAAWRATLHETGQWGRLLADPAGRQLLQILHLGNPAQAEPDDALASDAPWARRRIALADFRGWASDALEGARFVPESDADAPVVILPLAQLFARPFAALVLPGCDEKRLAAPDPGLAWSAAQRIALGIATREQLAASQLAAWRNALAIPEVDLLWHASDAGGELLSPSPLLLQLLLERGAAPADDPRVPRRVPLAPTLRSRPCARELTPALITASAYESLRRCPYQFFALQQLGLSEAAEIDVEADKRDFGNWLHRVLKLFHESLANEPPAPDLPARRALIEVAAAQATLDLELSEDEFLPFSAAWPRVRDGYLDWLAQHASTGAAFEGGEVERERRIGALTLRGRIDRIDRAANGAALLIDYKTESPVRTRERIAEAGEDTQLAFYAALLDDASFSALYLNVAEKDGTSVHEQPHAMRLRDALVAGLSSELERIADGAPLPPLGEGVVCDWCAARGLCRKDFWS